MEDQTPTNTASSISCDVCFKAASITDFFCNSCGYPLKGSEMEQKTFIVTRNNNEIDLADANKKIKRAGNILYWLAGSTVLLGAILYFTSNDPEGRIDVLITNLILAVIYIALGMWSAKKPLAAIVSGFALYILVLILNAFVSPASIASGIFIKIIFIGYFINGVKSAIQAEKIKKELNIE